MRKLISYIIGAGLGIWVASLFVPRVIVQPIASSNFLGIPLSHQWHLFVLFGILLGLLNFFVKPILNVITFPLRFITLGLFGFVINMGLVWIVDAAFQEFSIPFFIPLLLTTFIIWISSLSISVILAKGEKRTNNNI